MGSWSGGAPSTSSSRTGSRPTPELTGVPRPPRAVLRKFDSTEGHEFAAELDKEGAAKAMRWSNFIPGCMCLSVFSHLTASLSHPRPGAIKLGPGLGGPGLFP